MVEVIEGVADVSCFEVDLAAGLVGVGGDGGEFDGAVEVHQGSVELAQGLVGQCTQVERLGRSSAPVDKGRGALDGRGVPTVAKGAFDLTTQIAILRRSTRRGTGDK